MERATAPSRARLRAETPARAETSARPLEPSEAAWLAAVPCALLLVVAIALLGPPFGHAFLERGRQPLWSGAGSFLEPAEHGRYLISLLGPPLLAAAILAIVRRRLHLGPTAIRVLAGTVQTLTFAFVVVCFAAQNNIVLTADRPLWEHTRYFTPRTLLIAALLPLALLGLLRVDGVARRALAAVRETRGRRRASLAVALLFTILWLLTVVNLDSSLGNTAHGVAGHILWSMDETFAILNGRTPLVNFHPEYGQLWPYLVALAMSVVGTTIGVYTILMASISGATLLAVYAVLRRVTHSSTGALALYLPFVATGFYMKIGPLDDRYGPANLFSLWPIRYGGPYLLAWLLSRHIDRLAPRRLWPLFLATGLTLLNNPEFGAGAFAATVVALVCVEPPRSRAAAARLLGHMAAGLAGAVAFVTLLTLVRSGSLPHFGLLLEFSRLYAIDGWAMLPMPKIGIFLLFYLTFTAAIVVAVVRVLRRDEERVLTAMLAWSGTFGLIAGGYFAGRSHPQTLIDLLSPLTFSLALLVVVVVRALAARGWRRPTVVELAVLFGFGIAICSIAQTPTPWGQIARLRDRTPAPIFRQPEAKRFIASVTRPGETVEILIPLGHRIAYDLGLVNISPYSSIESMPTLAQLRLALAVLRAAHGTKLFISARFTFQEEINAIITSGFKVRKQVGDTAELVDRRAAAR